MRYPAGSVQLGSAASSHEIITNLVLLGLVSCTPDQSNRLGCRLTDAGASFLDLLHPDCEDADLPFRHSQWQAEWPASRSAMERYLRTFFGKQRRFAALKAA